MRDPNKSIEQKQPTEARTLFEEFWNRYPENCSYKVDRERCRAKYAELLAGASDPVRFHHAVIAALERWRGSELWSKENGRFIRAPLNWLDRRAWEDAPAPRVAAEAARKVPARLDWILCRERCRNCTGNGCGKGIKVPPAQSAPPFPPQECRHFAGMAGG